MHCLDLSMLSCYPMMDLFVRQLAKFQYIGYTVPYNKGFRHF